MCGNKGSPPSPSAASTAQTGATGQYGTSSATGTTSADPFIAALYRQYLGGTAQNLRNLPMTPEQLSAAANLYSLGMSAGTFDPAKVAAIQSPYTQNVVDTTEAAFSNMNRQQANDLLSRGISSGNAFGGDRAGVAAAALGGQQTTAEAPVIAGLYQSGYSQALDEYNRLKQMGLTGAAAGVQGANITGNRPFDLANWYASQIGGLGPLLGQTTTQAGTQTQMGNYTGYYTPPQPNPWTQGLGLGLTAFGAFSPSVSPFQASQSNPSTWIPAPYASKRGGLVPRKFQAGGLSMPSDIVVPGGIRPLALTSRNLPSMNLSMPSMSAIHVPSLPQGTKTTPQTSPWAQGADTLIKGFSSLNKPVARAATANDGGGGTYDPLYTPSVGDPTVAGGLYARGGYAEGGSDDLDDIKPLALQTSGLTPMNLSQPALSEMKIPSMPGQGGGGGGQSSGQSTSSSSSSGGWGDVISAGVKLLPLLFAARGGDIDPTSRDLAVNIPRTFYGPTEPLPDTPDAFRERYGRDPMTDRELEYYFGPQGSPLHRLKLPPRHFQFGGDDTPVATPVRLDAPGILGGLGAPRGDEPVQTEEGPDATVTPVMLRGAPFRAPRPSAEPKAPVAKPIPGAYTPGAVSDVPGLGIRPPTAMQEWATNPLTQAGLAMMSSRSPNFLTGLSEGFRGAQTALQQQRAAEVALDTPHKMLTDFPTLRYQMADGRIIDTKIPNPSYEAPETEEGKTIKQWLAKGYVYDPKTKTLSAIKGGPADPEVKTATEAAKAKGKWGPPPVVDTPAGPVPAASAGRVMRLNASYGDDFDHVKETGGTPFDYTHGAPEDIAKGDSVPAPTKVGDYSVKALQTAAESYLLEGPKALPKFTGSKTNPNQVQAYKDWTTAITNYAITMGTARGLSPAELAEAMRFGARGSDIRWKLSVDGRQAIALGTAMRHLDTLNQLYDAWDPTTGAWIESRFTSGLKARLAAEFGDAAVTNINTAVSMLGPEIVKAIGVAGAGTEADREEMKHNFSLEANDEQRRGAVKVAKRLMAGKLEGNHKQATSVGVKDADYAKIVGEEQYTQLQKLREEEKGGKPAEKKPTEPEKPPGAGASAVYDPGTKTWSQPVKEGTAVYDPKTRTWKLRGKSEGI